MAEGRGEFGGLFFTTAALEGPLGEISEGATSASLLRYLRQTFVNPIILDFV